MQAFSDHPSQGLRQQPVEAKPSAHLSAEEVAALQEQLTRLLDEHRRRLADNEDLFRALTDDSTVDAAQRQAARRAAEQEFVAIQETSAALYAIDGHSYGLCGACGNPIPFERLEALPTTRSCVLH